MIPEIIAIGEETPIHIGIVCSQEDYGVLKKFKKYFLPAMNYIAGKRVSVNNIMPGDDIAAGLLAVLNCDVLLIILSVDLISDDDFIRERTGIADMLISRIDRNVGSINAIYILARNVDTTYIPHPKSNKIMILPINQLPLNQHENEDDAYIMLCKHIALEIQHLRDRQTIEELKGEIRRLEHEK